MSHSIGILATGAYLPHREVGNDEIAELTGASRDWIETKTRIRSRRFAAPDEATSDLAARAALSALAQAGVSPERLDYLILSTSTPDQPLPPSACLVQAAIGAHRAACFDLNAACSGFVYSLRLAQGLVRQQPDALVLVVGADLYSRSLDFSDRRTAVLLGDGAGAALVGSTSHGFLAFHLSSRGDLHDMIRIEAGGSRLPASHETVDAGRHLFRMDGRAVRDFVLAQVPSSITKLVANEGLAIDQLDHVIPHQPNGVLLDQLAEQIGAPRARLHRTVEDYANLGNASVPVTLDQAHRSGALHAGDLAVLSGFGGGMALGTCLLRWAAT
jgi:3-oxoacyl-(acyl-carrier-protein) synthase III